MLLIHIETGNISFDNHSTNEPIYEFLLRQQGDCKKIIDATLTYQDPFSYYIKYFLNDIDTESTDRFDFFTKKKFEISFLKIQ